jgi:outer membrane immunogenic protein
MPHSAAISLCDISHLSGVHNRAINHDNNHLLVSGDIMRKTLFGLMAVASATGTAHAEGLRAELHGGFDGLDRRNSSSSEDGFGGIGVGYDFSINDKTFIGVEANLDESGANIRGNGGALAIETSVKANLDINVNTRIGTTLGDGKTKVYALAGYANLRIKARVEVQGGPTFTDSANADGYRVGLGVQRDIGKRAYAKVEYRYTNYEGGFTRNQGLVGIGIRF